MYLMAINEAKILQSLGLGVVKKKDPVGDGVSIAIIAWSEDKLKTVREILEPRGSGTLAKSILPMPLENIGTVYKLEITGPEYADFIDQGVNGIERSFGSVYSFQNLHPSRGMIDGLMEWNKTTGRTVPNQAHPEIQTYEQLAFVTAVNVKKHGIKPSHFTDKAFGQDSEKELAKAIELAVGHAVEVQFTAIAKQYNNGR